MRVYRVTHRASGKIYIGATTKSMEQRVARHFFSALVDEKPGAFYDAVRADGMKAFDWDVLHEAGTEPEMWETEKALIADLDCVAPNGLNERKGRGGWRAGLKRGPMSETERRKRSLANRGRTAWNKGIPHTFKAREKMRGRATWNKGVKRTEAEKQAMRDGIAKSRAHGKHHPMCKPIECDGTVYQSVRDMERRTGLSRAGIYYRLSKGRARFI